MLLKLCDGHPYTLEVLRRAAEAVDSRLPLGLTRPTEIDVDEFSITIADRLFDEAFRNLSSDKRDILLIVSLFEGGISVKNLHKVATS